MDRPKPARALPFVFVVTILTACNGELSQTNDEVSVKDAGAGVGEDDDASEPTPVGPCPPGVEAGYPCDGEQLKCKDSTRCTMPMFSCTNGVWKFWSDSPCTTTQMETCPETTPSELDGCPQPLTKCSYPDSCSLRPKTAPSTRVYECLESKWAWVSPSYDVACPPVMPTNDAPCEPSCGWAGACKYADACGSASAACEPRSATWHVTGTLCSVDDGGTGTDAGPGSTSDAEAN